MPKLQCEIVTPESKLYSDETYLVVLPAAEGEMGVLFNHEPIVTTLNSGSVRVTEEEGKEPIRFIVAGGYAQIEGTHVMILADRAAAVQEIDETAIKVHIDDLKDQMKELADDDPSKDFIQSEIDWNQLLLDQSK